MIPLTPIIAEAVVYAGATTLLAEGAKYIHDSMSTPLRKPVNNAIPTKTKLSNLGSKGKKAPLTESTKNTLAQKGNLSKYSAGVNAALAVATGALSVATSESMGKAQTASDEAKAANDNKRSLVAGSHFLENQVNTKQSIDYMIDAINAQTVALFQAISPISLHLASLVTAVNASTDAILGLDPSVSVPASPAPVINVPAPSVNVSVPTPSVSVSVPPATAPNIIVEAPNIPDYSSQMDKIAEASVARKESLDFYKTVVEVKDVNGSVVLNASPRAVQLAKNAALAKGEADTNSIGSSTLESVEELFNDMDITPNMFTKYVRFDDILKQAGETANGGSDNWEQLMEGFFK